MESVSKRAGKYILETRKQIGWTAEKLANEMREIGFSYSASRVSELENGKRQVPLAEMVGLAVVFSAEGPEVKLADFFQGESNIDLNEKFDITASHFREILSGKPISQDVSEFPKLLTWAKSDLPVWVPSPNLPDSAKRKQVALKAADTKAIATLKLSKEEFLDACFRTWGHSLSVERDSRAEGLAGKALGHVTRQLMNELRANLGRGSHGDD